MAKDTWLEVWCEYEGPSVNPTGGTFRILVETDDFEEARRMIRDNESLIDDFVEHSIRENLSVTSEYSLREVLDEISGLTGINWAISQDGCVYSLSGGKVVKNSD